MTDKPFTSWPAVGFASDGATIRKHPDTHTRAVLDPIEGGLIVPDLYEKRVARRAAASAKLNAPNNLALRGLREPMLDTGMAVREAVQRAAAWWDRKGRVQMRQHQLRQAEPVGSAHKGNGAVFADTDPTSDNFMPSNIILGMPWAQLDQREQLRVTKVWHHFFIRRPDLLDVDGEIDWRMGGDEAVN